MSVVILGSKPEPKIPKEYSKIAFINGSVYSYKMVRPDSIKYHFIARASFYDTEYGKLNSKLNLFKNQEVDKLILFYNKNNEIELFKSMLATIKYNYKSSEFISRTKRTMITTKTVGLLNRIKYANTLPTVNLSTKLLFTIRILNVFGIQNASIKPSTGVFALLYFLFYRLDPGPFYLAGIGCKDDGHESDKNKNYNLAHLHLDLSILKQLSKSKYSNDIFCTEKELSEATGLNYCLT